MTNSGTTAFSDEQFTNPFPKGIEYHYWHRARHRILMRKIGDEVRSARAVLDLGCGPGVAVDALVGDGIEAFGADLGTPEPATARIARRLHLGASAFALEPEFRERIEVVLLMDVLEHLEEPAEFLRQAKAAYPNARTFFVTVPARMEIWSNYDEYYGHFTRYDQGSLAALATRAGFRVRTSGYFFHALYAAARAVQPFQKGRPIVVRAPEGGTVRAIHQLIARVFDWEERLLPSGARGSSLFAVLEPEANRAD